MAKKFKSPGVEKVVNPIFKNRGPKGKLVVKDITGTQMKPGKRVTKTK